MNNRFVKIGEAAKLLGCVRSGTSELGNGRQNYALPPHPWWTKNV